MGPAKSWGYSAVPVFRQAVLSVLFVAVLSGCDAWPTTFDNRSSATVQFRYRHQDCVNWSAPFSVSAEKATRLARAHYADEIVGLRVRDGRHFFSLSPEAIRRMHKVCSRSLFDRLTTLGDCWLTYHGKGRFTFSREATPGISYEELGNEG